MAPTFFWQNVPISALRKGAGVVNDGSSPSPENAGSILHHAPQRHDGPMPPTVNELNFTGEMCSYCLLRLFLILSPLREGTIHNDCG
jgi:hypothetical protein